MVLIKKNRCDVGDVINYDDGLKENLRNIIKVRVQEN